MEFMFTPSASRDGHQIRKRLINEAQKAYEKQKLHELEQLEPEKLEARPSATTMQSEKPVFETTALYFSDIKKEEKEDGEDTDSNISGYTMYFQNVFLDKCCRKLISSHKGYTLSWHKFLTFTFILQVPLHYLLQHVQQVNRWGALMVLVICFTAGILVCIPVYMYYTMVGYFTRKSYIRYWDSVPLLKGVAFALAGVSLYQQMHNTILSAIALGYIIDTVNPQLPWENCSFPHASTNCIPWRDSYPRYNYTCCPIANCSQDELAENTFKYAAYDYYHNQILGLGYDDTPDDTSYNWKLSVYVMVIWIIVYVTVTAGMRRFATTMTVINLFMYSLLLPVIVLTFFIGPDYGMIWMESDDMASISNYKYWFNTGINIIHREIPTDVISFSSVSRVGVSVTVDTVIAYIMRLFFTAIFSVWVSVGVTFQQRRYNVESPSCIHCSADVLFFALFPDIISELPVPQIWLIMYFTLIFLWGISTVIYVYNAFVDALSEEFRSIEKWRVITAALVCGGAGAGATSMLCPTVMSTTKHTITNVMPPVTVFLLCISLLGLYVYSMIRFKHDYHFFTGEILGNYWAIGLKVATLAIVIASILIWLRVFQGDVENPLPLYMALAAIIGGMLVSGLRYFLKVTKTLISPSSKWGPPGRRHKLARIKFDPSHDLHYRSFSQKCNHDCLLSSAALKKEVKFWINRKCAMEDLDSSDEEEEIRYRSAIRFK